MIKMKPELKSKWIDALTSGEYVQAVGELYAGETEHGKPMMCCLGVLEHICGTNCDDMKCCEMPSDIDDSNEVKHKSPDDVLDQLIPTDGVSKSLGTILAKMNDEGGSFEQIADYINVNL